MIGRLNGTDSANGQIAPTPSYDAQPVIRERQPKSGLSLNFTLDRTVTTAPDDPTVSNTIVTVSAVATATVTASATARCRTNLALHHLFAACRFSAQIGRIEHENAGQPFGEFWEEILQYSLGVVTLSVASLESYANEHMADGALSTGSLPSKASESIAALIDREPILSKFNLVLELRTGRNLDFGSNVVQCADLLIKLRNAAIHFRPEWDDEDAAHAKLSSRLQHRFERSPYFPNEGLFPRAWATRSFSVWALKSTIAFLEHFGQESGLDSKLAPFRERLSRFSDGAV